MVQTYYGNIRSIIMGRKTMKEKRLVDAHMENFNFEAMTDQEHYQWIVSLLKLLDKYRQVRGR